MMQYGPLIERLLAGKFICNISDFDAFRHLHNEQTRQSINDYLRPLNRRIVSNDSNTVYYLGYCELTPQVRNQLTSQFSVIINALLPLLEWMRLVQETLGQENALTAGDVLKLAEIVARVEDNQSLRHRLNQLAGNRFFNSQSSATDIQLKLIFNRLKEHGYLTQPHSDRQYFYVTGKIDYLIDVIRFIRDEEHLPVEDTSPVQENLL
ncbi:condensin complex protein MksE [Xenorhabdus bovienii]|uniref:condensin complex protein MksE n=1 Tax=Xenorhabdus bovienii TaxID=40576 RepID=UPI003DA5363E